MALIIKYEKIDNTHMRKWILDDTVIVKGDLQNESAHLNNIINQDEDEKEKIKEIINPQLALSEYNSVFQIRQDELDVLIDLFNNQTTTEEIDFLNE
jgi:hypothetical protein